MKNLFVFIATVLFVFSCGDDPIPIGPPTPQPDDPTEDWTIGVKDLELTLPQFTRFEQLFAYDSLKLQMRGADTKSDYLLNIKAQKSGSGYSIVADSSEVLRTLPHQRYYLSYFDCFDVDGVGVRVPIEAALNVVNSDSVDFVSSVALESESFGSGTAEDPYIISDEASLHSKFLDQLDAGNTLENTYFIQSSIIYTTISRDRCAGDSNTPFMGNYNGLNSGIYLLSIVSDKHSALLYCIGDKGSVSNLTLGNISVNSDGSAAALAYELDGGKIDNVSVNGSIRGSEEVGSLISIGYGTISNCDSHAIIQVTDAEGRYVGGLVGCFDGDDYYESKSLTMTNCTFSGEIDARESKDVGGLVGYVDCGTHTFSKCYTSGEIVGDSSVGGLIGFLSCFDDVTFTDCMVGVSMIDYYYMQQLSPMDVSIQGDTNVGGLFGVLIGGENAFTGEQISGNRILLTNCMFGYNGSSGSYDFVVDGVTNIGGLVGYAYDIIMQNTKFTNYGEILSRDEDIYANQSSVGGVFGLLSKGDFTGSTFSNWGTVRGSSMTGGVVGELSVGGTSQIYGTPVFENYGYVDGVTLDNDEDSYTGGVIGKYHHECDSDQDYNYCPITLINNANVDGIDNVGGLVGYSEGLPMLTADSGVGVAASSSVTISGDEHTGGAYGLVMLFEDHNVLSDYGFEGTLTATIKGGYMTGGHIGKLKMREGTSFFLSLKTVSQLSMKTSRSYCGGVIGFSEMYKSTNLTISSYDKMGESTIETMGDCAAGVIAGTSYNSYCEDPSFTEHPKLQLEYCYNTIDISTMAGGTGGHFAGIVSSPEFNMSIYACCNLGDIAATGDNTGGIVAQPYEVCNINRCYNAGKISGASNRGGIAGNINYFAMIRDCFNMGEVPAGGSNVAGIVGRANYEKKVEILWLDQCYNCGTTGYGILGGVEDLGDDETSVLSCYYLESASNGDIDIKHEKAEAVDDNYLRNELYFELRPGAWAYDKDSYPYLKEIEVYEKYPGN